MDSGLWSSFHKGQVVSKFLNTNKLIFWLYGETEQLFRTLETQIDETLQLLGLDSSVWVFPKHAMSNYDGFCALLRSKLADHAQNPSILICNPDK